MISEMRLTNRAAILARAAFSLLLLVILVYAIGYENIIAKFSAIDPLIMLAVVALLMVQNIAGGLRWAIIISRLGSRLSFRKIYGIYVIGSVSNLILLASIGGISVRAVLLTQQGVRLTPVVIGLFIERIFVYLALLASFVAGAYILKQNLAEQFVDTAIYYGLLITFFLAALAILIVMFLRFGKTDYGRNAANLFATVFRSPMAFVMLTMVSFAVLFLGFAAIGIIARGLDIDTPILLLLSVQPVIAIAASLPVSLGGWGVREGGMVIGLSFLNVNANDALALSILYGVAGVIATLLVAVVAINIGFLKGIVLNNGASSKKPEDISE